MSLQPMQIFVLDSTGANVALGKPAVATPQYCCDSTVYTAASAVNGVIDYDNNSGDMTHSLSSVVFGDVWWYVR